MTRSILGTALTMLLGWGLMACAGNPRREVPSLPPAATGNFIGSSDPSIVASAPPVAWWHLFDDPALNEHVQRALAANTSVRLALANLDSARVAARASGAALLPATVIESGAGPERADRQPSTSSVPKTSYELGATISWEIDLFGRLRSAARAARADADASAAALDAVRIAVVGDTVASYLEWCAADARSRLAAQQTEAQSRSYEILADQLAAGEVSPLELSQSKLLRDRIAAGATVFIAERQRAAFALLTLQGRFPSQISDLGSACSALPRIRVPLPVGDGAMLIARRPDIREAEQRLAAATARIGVATADLYPRIQLGGSAGRIAGGTDSILTPLITWAFPNQSAVRARIAQARGGAAGALAAWDQTLLRALAEVEGLLADYRAQLQLHESLALARVQAEEVLRRSQARQRLGADSYLVVLDGERSRNELASQQLQTELRIAQLQVALFRALGGGWEGHNSG